VLADRLRKQVAISLFEDIFFWQPVSSLKTELYRRFAYVYVLPAGVSSPLAAIGLVKSPRASGDVTREYIVDPPLGCLRIVTLSESSPNDCSSL